MTVEEAAAEIRELEAVRPRGGAGCSRTATRAISPSVP